MKKLIVIAIFLFFVFQITSVYAMPPEPNALKCKKNADCPSKQCVFDKDTNENYCVPVKPLQPTVWQNAAIAITTSLILVGLIFMIGMGFSINELQFMAKEEFFQIIAVVVMVAVLFGSSGLLNSLSTNSAFTGNAPTIQAASAAIIDSTLADTTKSLTNTALYDEKLSAEASRSYSCSISGIGYTVSGCGGFSMLATPISMAGSISGFAIGELSAMKKLIDLSQAYAITLLLPFGIVLRTFKLTRGAGGLIIAVAISLHLLLPIGVIFNDMLAQNFLVATDLAKVKNPEKYTCLDAQKNSYSCVKDYLPDNNPIELSTCNPSNTGSSPVGRIFGAISTLGTSEIGDFNKGDNEDRAIGSYIALRRSIRSQLFIILIRATLGPVLALTLVAAGIRAITALAGADVDVSAISRFV
ncbi:hypothetical protein HY988_06905 [Candidatus Micrarchaeota archaeon]|nr:hypothetical protein [Candidatus Micrarchaeota archaeon]